MWRHFIRMFDPSILMLVAALSFGLTLAKYAGIVGIPLALLLTSWLFKYAYALLDEVASGVAAAPVLSVEMINPLSQRPLAQLAICLAAGIPVLWTTGWLRVVVEALLLALLPASIAVLGASGRVLQAINPVALLTVVRSLGRYYAVILVVATIGTIAVTFLAATTVWLIVKLAAAQFVLLAVFNLIGGALYERRDELDLDVVHSPERIEARAEQERVQRRGRMLEEIYTQARVHKYAAIDDVLLPWLDELDPMELGLDAPQCIASAISWNDRAALVRVATPCILRLHKARLIVLALDGFDATLTQDPAFHVGSNAVGVELAELAKASGRRTLARKIVANCDGTTAGLDVDNRLARLRRELEL